MFVGYRSQLIESQKQFDQPNEKCELCQECRLVSAIYRAIFEYHRHHPPQWLCPRLSIYLSSDVQAGRGRYK